MLIPLESPTPFTCPSVFPLLNSGTWNVSVKVWHFEFKMTIWAVTRKGSKWREFKWGPGVNSSITHLQQLSAWGHHLTLFSTFDLSAELLKTIAHTTRGLRENCNITTCRKNEGSFDLMEGECGVLWSVHRLDVPASYLFDIWLRFVIGEFINDIYNKNTHALLGKSKSGNGFFSAQTETKTHPKNTKKKENG